MDKLDIIQGDNVEFLTPTVELKESGEDCVYLEVTCNSTNIIGMDAKIEVRHFYKVD